ncbi:hypothetical protein C6I21_04235 [Alkalicoccus urumqiensis]|uniref:Uncharacterized protein n=1 Tax=Alkalicoccus urumqiensis TaxID=1548213 RepID=A0A2P6MJV4_ALKUR|nr:hypothetical protein C6I21_04235 [Alkalicoccus urumqiensis]
MRRPEKGGPEAVAAGPGSAGRGTKTLLRGPTSPVSGPGAWLPDHRERQAEHFRRLTGPEMSRIGPQPIRRPRKPSENESIRIATAVVETATPGIPDRHRSRKDRSARSGPLHPR